MSGLGKALPRSEWLKWLRDVYSVTQRAVASLSNTAEDHERRIEECEEGRAALSRGMEALSTGLLGLEERVRALEGRPKPDPGPEPEPEPEPGPEPEPEPEPRPDPDPEPSPVLKGTGSKSTSFEKYPRVKNETVGDWYVDGNRTRSGDGRTPETAFRTIQEGLAALQDGQTLLVRGGTYEINSRLNRTRAWSRTTRVMGYGNERPHIRARGFRTTNDSILRFQESSRNELWHRFYITDVNEAADQKAVIIGGQGITVSNVWASHIRTTAFYVGQNTENVHVLDCAAWRIGDGSGTHTNVGDGFAASAWTTGRFAHAVFARCYTAHAPDDGYDLWGGRDCEILDSVSAFAGTYWNGNRAGDGNAYKLGGDNRPGGKGAGKNNTVIGSLSVRPRAVAFNHNVGGGDAEHTISNNTSYGAGRYGFDIGTRSEAASNLSASDANASYSYSNSRFERNSWQQGITNPRFANPEKGDYSLAPGSPAIGAGVDGENQGASIAALEIHAVWSQRDLTTYANLTWPDVPHSEEDAA